MTADNPRPTRSPGRAIAVAARVVVLLVGVGACLLAVALGRHPAPPAGLYACPMHPEAQAVAPGACPLCGMALVPVADHRALVPAEDITAVTSLTISRDLGAAAWRRNASVEAPFYRDEAALLVPGEVAHFRPAAGPAIEARLVEVAGPAEDPALITVRFHLVEGPPGEGPGWIELAPRNGRALVVPYRAVIQSPRGPYVLAVGGDGRTLAPRPVTLGRVFLGFVTVVHGLGEGERLVGARASLFEGQRRQGLAAP